MTFQNLPRVSLEVHRRCHELGAINDRAATDRQEEVQIVGTYQLDGPHQRFIGGVGFNAAELVDVAAMKGCADLFQGSVFFSAAATVEQQDPSTGRNSLTQLSD
jgi:hypothetical protein